ncbi:MAG: fimbrillin family protein [Alistipes sp.]|nr:fimbrillin family protein [Alistipes sp.]
MSDKMRRLFNIAVALALLTTLHSCNRGEERGGAPAILFRSEVEQCRGGLIEGVADMRERGISIMGAIENSNGDKSLVFDHEHLAYDESLGWNYGDTRYWIRGMKYHFTAIYPYDDSDYSYDTASGTVTCLGYNAGERHLNTDFMYAVAERDLSDMNSTPDYSAVELPFKHACAAVEFRLRNSSNATITAVTDVSLVGVCAEGDFSLAADGTPTWDIDTSNRVTNHDTFGGICTLPAGGLPVNTSYFHSIYDSQVLTMLPQRVSKSGATLHFNIRIEGSSTVFPHEVNLGNIASTPKWDAGTRYIYNLTLTDETITFDVTVVDWIEDFIEL